MGRTPPEPVYVTTAVPELLAATTWVTAAALIPERTCDVTVLLNGVGPGCCGLVQTKGLGVWFGGTPVGCGNVSAMSSIVAGWLPETEWAAPSTCLPSVVEVRRSVRIAR